MKLQGKVALVSGACGDIGKAIALAFAQEGAALTLTDVGPESDAAALLEEVRQSGGQASYFRADVSDREQVDDVVNRSLANFGKIDICLGNAGIVEPGPFLATSRQSWEKHLAVNLTGCFHVGQAVAKSMVDQGRPGKIIFTSSWVQDVPFANLTSYCVSKSGLKMLAQCMALELGPHHITVNLIAPGFVDAGLSGRMFKENPAILDESLKIVPLGRLMAASEVAGAALLLCSPGAEYMTGTTLLIDGGNSLFQRAKTPGTSK